jgi:Asp-tRNA(Asn)/Glu-tRNA(Gln) amidotransferase A subunit family amidase
MADHFGLSARDAAARIAAGTLTAEALVRSCLRRIEALEPSIGAWKFLDRDAALAEALQRDRSGANGALRGVPVGVKDNIDTADMPTGYGSAAYEGFRPAADAACVALLRAAGAIALGKTVSTEFAAVAPGKTRNPHNPAHTPGGSSSGSAAAVATGMVPLALGTQTAGSVIRPASFCGVVGYKPSFGTIERTGVKTLAGSLDTVGVIARDVRDAAFFTSVVAGRPTLAVPADLPTPRIGLFRTEAWERAEPSVAAALERTVAALGRRGMEVSEAPSPPGYDDLLPTHDAIMAWDMVHALAFEHRCRADRLAAKTLEFLNARSLVTVEAYDQAQAKALALRAGLDRLFGDCDVLLTPAAPGEAPEGLSSTGDASFNRGWTLLHVPCITVPAGTGPKGLPIGVQLVGRIGDDARALAAAAAVEAALAAC